MGASEAEHQPHPILVCVAWLYILWKHPGIWSLLALIHLIDCLFLGLGSIQTETVPGLVHQCTASTVRNPWGVRKTHRGGEGNRELVRPLL